MFQGSACTSDPRPGTCPPLYLAMYPPHHVPTHSHTYPPKPYFLGLQQPVLKVNPSIPFMATALHTSLGMSGAPQLLTHCVPCRHFLPPSLLLSPLLSAALLMSKRTGICISAQIPFLVSTQGICPALPPDPTVHSQLLLEHDPDPSLSWPLSPHSPLVQCLCYLIPPRRWCWLPYSTPHLTSLQGLSS